ncbi:UPF0193 protein EVG1 [Liparis tanakae]|uniref:UPF0193 protein EVG1 n=1 Tax=Liparis tanakae TaxID=230148 RepID=A0A4Z2GWS9_9TELE|nr:UPF0193 protein EVG1 [Liparis tanakae]
MEASSQSRDGGGLCNKPRASQYSKETQDLLRSMMKQSRFTNRQRKQINECLKRDLEKEKRKLQNILATGEEEPKVYRRVPARPNPEAAERKDRYQEVLEEIQERRQFLADMSSLGQEKQYLSIINTQISQRVRELQVLDKTRSPQNKAISPERKGETTEKTALKETEGRVTG